MLTLLDLFRALSSFAPTRTSLKSAPWEQYVEWAVGQGLAPLAAYNLEYRFAGGGAPEWARERLLGIYQGLLNDNVMKLVNFKRSIDGLEGRKVALVGAASFAEVLYPHVAFRPVAELRLLVPRGGAQPLGGFLKRAEFKPAETPPDEPLAPALVVSDNRTIILIHESLVPGHDDAMLGRAVPARVYGPSMFRLTPEDALLVQLGFAARAGFDVPFIEWVDLRELVLAADGAVVRARTAEWHLERALYAAGQVVGRLFPEVAMALAAMTPDLPSPLRKLLDLSVVEPASQLGRSETSRPAEALRALLTTS